ncbi:MAG: D-alanine--D-alanine ligase [Candidatus Vogelbacteria bacterium]|nr:D-alanine--D-alanine ligase [Candidatus Vogelbacteria bacterium]
MLRVGVLRGGPSSEYDVSLITGGNVLKALEGRYRTKDILVTKDGVWHMDGLEILPERIIGSVDMVFNALHGEYGEDGKVQQVLDSLNIPYTGSGSWASAVAMNKSLAKDYFRRNGIRTPMGITIERNPEMDYSSLAKDVFQKVSPNWFVKPNDGGSSVGTSFCKSRADLEKGLEEAFKYSDSVLVEEYIRGREATCGVIDNFRDKKHYSLLPIEIIKPSDKDFFDYQCKYDGTTQEICPGNFTKKESHIIQDTAVKIHKAFGLRHYSRSDFIVTKKGVYALEVNTLPGLTSESLFPKAMAAVGTSYEHFLDHLISLAIKK